MLLGCYQVLYVYISLSKSTLGMILLKPKGPIDLKVLSEKENLFVALSQGRLPDYCPDSIGINYVVFLQWQWYDFHYLYSCQDRQYNWIMERSNTGKFSSLNYCKNLCMSRVSHPYFWGNNFLSARSLVALYKVIFGLYFVIRGCWPLFYCNRSYLTFSELSSVNLVGVDNLVEFVVSREVLSDQVQKLVSEVLSEVCVVFTRSVLKLFVVQRI